MRSLARLFLALFMLSVAMAPAEAAQRLDLSVDQLTRHASVIVEGEVTAVRSDWNPDRTRIYTTVTVRADQVHKGEVPQASIDIRLLGGTVGDITLAIVDQPRFEPNERVFLFLRANFDQRDLPVVGDSGGKFRVVAAPTGGEALEGAYRTIEKNDAVRNIRSVLRPIGQ